ncbi:helix-turn-helix transcriptional regulator [Clostridium sp. C2-6-12]|uniref:AraC family transcriptional regulator n=1 Tax=Clostridium sp. C2-6-12 TaxID=2698832 RepID=UPI0013716E76|nr:helix-turn-helix transcriptional regulator [Clostridium sp. C2-6-12]
MNFGIELQNYNFLIKLENCSIRIIDGNWGTFKKSFTNHMHSYYELHYVSGGQGALIADTLNIPLYKGCFYLLPPRINHEQLSNPLDNLEEYHLAFELTCNSEKDLAWKCLFSNGYYNTNQNNLEIFFDNIVKESNEMQYGYVDKIHQNIQSIFITLIRSISKNNDEISVTQANWDDRRIMLIDQAFIYEYNTIALSTLSNKLKLSTRQTQRFIQDKYGVPFSTLKLRSRLSHAAMLLTTTKLSLDEISLQVGYLNYSFFSKSFKNQYKMTPMNYRKSHYQEQT